MSQETRDKIAAKSRGQKRPWAKAQALINLKKLAVKGSVGRKWTKRKSELFRAKRTGHTVTQETRNKISASKKGQIPWNKKTKSTLPALCQQPLMSQNQTASAFTSGACRAMNT
jgi:hypothetical protein